MEGVLYFLSCTNPILAHDFNTHSGVLDICLGKAHGIANSIWDRLLAMVDDGMSNAELTRRL